MMPKHILVPLDFSAAADHALAYAIPLAQTFQARLTLLHVLEPLALGQASMSAETEGTVAAWLYTWEMAAQRALLKPFHRVREAGLHGEALVRSGVPCQMILDVARVRRVHLIIMGTTGRTGLARVFLGSVAERVIRSAPVPVLIVPHQQGQCPEALETTQAYLDHIMPFTAVL